MPHRTPRSLLAALAVGAVLHATTLPASVAAQSTAPATRAGTPPAAAPARRAARPVAYEVAFPNAAHHEAEVTVTFPDLPAGPLQVRMSRSSPGRYALHEFAKNVYAVKAVDSKGRPLPITRPNPHQWNVAGHDGTVRLTYTLFGDRADGTYAAIDLTHARLNTPAAFVWARGLEQRPIRVAFTLPTGWQVASQLVPTADGAAFTAPHLQYFLDSPIEVGPFQLYTWTEAIGGPQQTLRMALHHQGTREDGERFVDMTKQVVREMAAVFGELPRFDFGTYTFLNDYLPYADGDGMEHRNSTSISGRAPLATNALGNLGTVSHEFFHAWNVERIRPRSLEPFNFEDANMSGDLWLAEGFTQYYGPLVIRRTGLTSVSDYARVLSGTVNAVLNAPGRRLFSPIEMSMQAPFVDAAVSIDPQNKPNTFISYYTWGAGVALALDLTLRERSPNLTLDDFMRAMWTRHGKPERDYAPTRPYTLADVRQVLAQVSGDAAFANQFIDRYIAGKDAPDYAPLLAKAGFLVRNARPGAAWLGDGAFRFENGRAVLAAGTLVGSPLYAAGLERDDAITALDGKPVTAQRDLDAILAAHRPGDVVSVAYVGRAGERTGSITLAESPRVEVVPVEDAGQPLTAEMRQFRARWLKGGA